MQVPMLALPFLSGQFNPVSAGYHLMKAYKDVGAVQLVGGGIADTGRAVAGKSTRGERFVEDIKARLKDPREREMVDALVKIGRIDAEAGLEIERLIRKKDLAGALVDAPLEYLEGITRSLPQAIEAMNRTVTAVAAYRMHMAKHKDHDAAVNFASLAVHDSQGQYSNTNAAPIFNRPVGRLALQFMKYPQLVYYMYGKNLRSVIQPQLPGDRRKAASTLVHLTAMHFAAAGVVGMLPYEALKLPMMMLQGLGLVGFSWEDLEDEFQERMAEITGSDYLARVIARGAPTAAGVDISARVGLQNMLTFGQPRSMNEEGVLAYLASTAGGAPGGLAVNVGRGARALADGDFNRAAENLLPLKTLADVARATTNYRSGMYNEQDFALRVFGLMPAHHAQISRERGASIRESRGRRDERTELMRQYMRATNRGELIRLEARIRTYNRDLDGGMRISIETLRQRRIDEQRRYQQR